MVQVVVHSSISYNLQTMTEAQIITTFVVSQAEGRIEETIEGQDRDFINTDNLFSLSESPINMHELELGLVDYND